MSTASANRTALITGASAGLGVAFAEQLAAQGMDLVLAARREERLAKLSERLGAEHGVQVRYHAADLADPEAPRRLYDSLSDIPIDCLINNAGIGGPDLLQDRDWAEQRAFFELMMISAAQLCHLFVPGMVERRWGRIINVSSVAARLPLAGGCNYGPAKAYLVALSEELSVTLANDGVKACALCPGFTHTEFHNEGDLKEMKDSSPRFLWYDAATVAAEGLRAVERGKSVYVSGRLYRWADPFFQWVWTRRLYKAFAAR